jgi:hypothetical protein
VSTLEAFEPAMLAVSEGTGLVTARRRLALDEESATWLGRSVVAAQKPEEEPAVAEGPWQGVSSLLMPGESGLESLVRGLVARGAPVPVHGYELGNAGWPAELAWPEHRVAVVLSGDTEDHEIADRDRAYRAGGWDARTAQQWDVDDLVKMITRGETR